MYGIRSTNYQQNVSPIWALANSGNTVKIKIDQSMLIAKHRVAGFDYDMARQFTAISRLYLPSISYNVTAQCSLLYRKTNSA